MAFVPVNSRVFWVSGFDAYEAQRKHRNGAAQVAGCQLGAMHVRIDGVYIIRLLGATY